jgi:hypothetical protein
MHVLKPAPRLGPVLVLVVACLVLSWPCAVRAQLVLVEPPAQPSAPDVARARESFKNGLAHAEAARWPDAVLAFDEAYRRSGNPVALLNLGAALRETGRFADARTCVIELRARHMDQLDPETRQLADDIYRTVTAVVDLHAAPASAITAIDGRIQPVQEQHFELDPGPHHFRVAAPGQVPFEWHGVLVAGEVRDLTYRAEVEPLAVAAAEGPAQAAPRQDAATLPSASARRRLPRWAIGLLVSAATLAVGAAVAVPLVLRNRGMDAPAGVDARYDLP